MPPQLIFMCKLVSYPHVVSRGQTHTARPRVTWVWPRETTRPLAPEQQNFVTHIQCSIGARPFVQGARKGQTLPDSSSSPCEGFGCETIFIGCMWVRYVVSAVPDPAQIAPSITCMERRSELTCSMDSIC